MATIGTRTYDNLIVGGNLITDAGIVSQGQVLARGAVLGKVTATGELKLSLTASNDGSEVPYAILNDACDNTAGAKSCPIILAGELNEGSLVLGAGHTVASIKDDLRDLGIYLKSAK